METLHFSIFINAPVSKVWETMIGEDSYKKWASEIGNVESEGSNYEGSWDKGAEIKFLAADEDGTFSGMIGKIAENKLHEFISIEYTTALYKNEPMEGWAGMHENYTFTEKDGGTELKVDLDVQEEVKQDMVEGWPKALNKLKELAES